MPAKDPKQTLRELTHLIDTVGLPAAFEALVGVCKDPKAPANSKATAGTTLFRAGGLFDKDAKRGNDKPPEEMTAEEIAERLAELRAITERYDRDLARAAAADNDPDSPDSEADPKDPFG